MNYSHLNDLKKVLVLIFHWGFNVIKVLSEFLRFLSYPKPQNKIEQWTPILLPSLIIES